jgi:hypothetical protein
MSEMGEMDVPMMVEEGPKEAAAAGVDGWAQLALKKLVWDKHEIWIQIGIKHVYYLFH